MCTKGRAALGRSLFICHYIYHHALHYNIIAEDKRGQRLLVLMLFSNLHLAEFLCTISASFPMIFLTVSHHIRISSPIIQTGPTPRFTSTLPSAARMPAVSSWNCVLMLCPRLLKISVLYAPERRASVSPDHASIVSSPISCAREEISPTTTVPVESPST